MKATEALDRLKEICSRQEKSPADLLALMKRWGVDAGDAEGLLERLREENYLSETRYAAAFVRDKIRFEHWGRVKIRFALSRKLIPDHAVDEALNSVDQNEYTEMIRSELLKKNKQIRDTDAYSRRQKLLRFGSLRGYETDIMFPIVALFKDVG